jgi:uncharacterized protein YndB with AHSA1/START domain
MNAPLLYALRLCKPAEHCSLSPSLGVLRRLGGSTFSSNSSTRANWAPPIVTKSPFSAAAERVYDAFLDPAKASKFLFATPTGENVRCEMDARVGGEFLIVDRRHGEDVAHKGKYLELDRPRRIVFMFSVEKYSKDSSTVTIEIAPSAAGCTVALTHVFSAAQRGMQERVRSGWSDILEVAGELLVSEAPSCGVGLAQHAAIPLKIATLFEGLAETLELHRAMLELDDPKARREDQVYGELAASWAEIARSVQRTAARMAEQRELPMGKHDEAAWGERNTRAFEKFVKAQGQLLARLRLAAPRDEEMLAAMTAEETDEKP